MGTVALEILATFEGSRPSRAQSGHDPRQKLTLQSSRLRFLCCLLSQPISTTSLPVVFLASKSRCAWASSSYFGQFLVHRDFARFNAFRFRQTQGQDALLDSSTDFGSVDSRIEFVHAPKVIIADLTINAFTGKLTGMPMAENGQFTIVDGNFKAGLIHPRHLGPDGVTHFGGFHIHQRCGVLHLPLFLGGKICWSVLRLSNDIHGLLQFLI